MSRPSPRDVWAAVQSVEPSTGSLAWARAHDYWSPFLLLGQGPAPGYVVSPDGGRQAVLRERLRAMLLVAADGTIHLTARAWAVRGRRR